MTLNEKVFNYKVLDLIILYNFDIKFNFIQDHMKKLWIFYMALFVGMDEANIFRGGSWLHLSLKIIFRGGSKATVTLIHL